MTVHMYLHENVYLSIAHCFGYYVSLKLKIVLDSVSIL